MPIDGPKSLPSLHAPVNASAYLLPLGSLLLGGCGSPKLEIDMIVDQHGVTYQYRAEGCECQPRFPQPGEGFQHQPTDTPAADCDCVQTCIERLDVNADRTFVIVGCGVSASATLPTALEATPSVKARDQDGKEFDVTVESPATSFYYEYRCPGGSEHFNEFHIAATSGIASDVCTRTTPFLVRSHQLTTTLETDLGLLRLWSTHSVSL